MRIEGYVVTRPFTLNGATMRPGDEVPPLTPPEVLGRLVTNHRVKQRLVRDDGTTELVRLPAPERLRRVRNAPADGSDPDPEPTPHPAPEPRSGPQAPASPAPALGQPPTAEPASAPLSRPARPSVRRSRLGLAVDGAEPLPRERGGQG